MYFDESRFGTRSKLGRLWFGKGKRPRIAVKLGFKYFYVYTAVNPETGAHHTLLLPFVNTRCMNMYLEHLSKWANGKKILLIMDGAGWHKSKDLKVPEGIELKILPPYCPELNPVERIWRYIKEHTIVNTVYTRLQVLEDKVCEFIKNIPDAKMKSICKNVN